MFFQATGVNSKVKYGLVRSVIAASPVRYVYTKKSYSGSMSLFNISVFIRKSF